MKSARQVARQLWREKIRRWRRERRRLRSRVTEEAIHEFRVATRRLRVALGVFAPLTAHPPVIRDLRKRLRAAASVLGAARDATVHGQHLTRHLNSLHLQEVLADWMSIRAHEKAKLFQAAADMDTAEAERRLEAFERYPHLCHESGSGGEYLLHRTREALQPVALFENFRESVGDPHRMHDLRIRIKRFRYALEMLNSIRENELEEMVRTTKRLQDHLGIIHDLDTLADRIRADVSWLNDESRVADILRTPADDDDMRRLTLELSVKQTGVVRDALLRLFTAMMEERQEHVKALLSDWAPAMSQFSKIMEDE